MTHGEITPVRISPKICYGRIPAPGATPLEVLKSFRLMTEETLLKAALKAAFSGIIRISAWATLATVMAIPAAAQQQQQVPLLQGQPGQQQAQQTQQATSVQRIAAVVNDEVITVYDLNERMSLVVAATGGVSSQEEYLQLREEVLRGMVDERLQIQEAAEFDLTISDGEVDKAITQIAQNNNMSREEFEKYLQSIGSDVDSMIPQVRASIAWDELVQGRYGPQVRVSDTEVEAVLERMKNNAGEPEYRVSEIYLILDAQQGRTEAQQTATRIARQIRDGADFASLARQFSDSASAAVGGDLGWVQRSQLVPAVANRIANMDLGEVSDPIRTAGGFYIVRLQDRRKILGADPLDTRFTLKQIAVSVSNQATKEEVTAVRQRVAEVTAGLNDCANVPAAAQELGTQTYGDVGQISARDLPDEVRNAIMDLEIGEASDPLVRGNRVQVLVVCGRESPDVELPSRAQIENRLTNQRLSMVSRRYLRDIRRDAIIDYRLQF